MTAIGSIIGWLGGLFACGVVLKKVQEKEYNHGKRRNFIDIWIFIPFIIPQEISIWLDQPTIKLYQ